MAISAVPSIYTELIEYLAEKATPEEILAFKVSAATQQRADELTVLNKSGKMSAVERDELDQLLEFDELVSLLKSRALKALKHP
jgi:hypothetical protein